MLGNANLLPQRSLTVVYSAPASVLLRAHDLVQRWRHGERVMWNRAQLSWPSKWKHPHGCIDHLAARG
ncbi:MAG: hypothetical protein R6W76_03595 [Caldilinea sp.]